MEISTVKTKIMAFQEKEFRYNKENK